MWQIKYRQLLPVTIVVLWSYSAHAEGFLYLPLTQGKINYGFCGYTNNDGSCHGGIDYKASGNPVLAASDGKVEKIKDNQSNTWGDKKAYGNVVWLIHSNGYKTIYAHLKTGTLLVSENQQVKAGQQLASANNSGWSSASHLHFEVRDPSGKKVDPYGNPPDYVNGCGPNALWAVCPPVPYDSSFDDKDEDGYTMGQGDCNDNDPDINPNAKEKCDNKDNDCDDLTDEDFKKGLAQDLGNSCTVGLGECQNQGTMVCTKDGQATVCSVDVKLASQEICDEKDNDCDSETDEDYPDLGLTCTIGTGACKSDGVYVCSGNKFKLVCNAPPFDPCCGDVCGYIDGVWCTCPSGSTCEGTCNNDDNCSGSCVTANCTDECPILGMTQCSFTWTDNFQSCYADSDYDKCLEWGSDIQCPVNTCCHPKASFFCLIDVPFSGCFTCECY